MTETESPGTNEGDDEDLVTGYKPILDAAGLPEDVAGEVSKTFDRRRIIRLLRDCYYLAPISIGRGGVIKAWASGSPGTGLRRPNGALYECPRSWRYSIMSKALRTGLVTEVGETEQFATTERGAALLDRLAECPECETELEPMIRKSVYVGNPNQEGSITDTSLTLRCPRAADHERDESDEVVTAWDISSGGTGYKPYDPDEETIETRREMVAEEPDVRIYRGEREVRSEAVEERPETDEEAIEDRLNELIEDQDDPRESVRLKYPGDPERGEVTDRSVVVIDSEGSYYRYVGTDEAISVSRTDEKGDMHISTVVEGEDGKKVRVYMDRETAVEEGGKDAVKSLHYRVADPSWNSSATAWEINLDTLAYSVDQITSVVAPEEDEAEWRGSEWTVTVEENVIEELIKMDMGVMGVNPETAALLDT